MNRTADITDAQAHRISRDRINTYVAMQADAQAIGHPIADFGWIQPSTAEVDAWLTATAAGITEGTIDTKTLIKIKDIRRLYAINARLTGSRAQDDASIAAFIDGPLRRLLVSDIDGMTRGEASDIIGTFDGGLWA